MFVCICNAYRDRDIELAARNGAQTAEDAYHALGNGPNCGCCLDTAEEIVQRVCDATAALSCGNKQTA